MHFAVTGDGGHAAEVATKGPAPGAVGEMRQAKGRGQTRAASVGDDHHPGAPGLTVSVHADAGDTAPLHDRRHGADAFRDIDAARRGALDQHHVELAAAD